MRIVDLLLDGAPEGLVTDAAPRIAFALDSETPGEALDHAVIRVGEWETRTTDQVGTVYGGPLAPHARYEVEVEAVGTSGATAHARTWFRTGRLGTPWQAQWITDPQSETPKGGSPVPLVFRRAIALRGEVARAWIEATALGVYELEIDGRRVGDRYFAPGFTSYRHRIQYQTDDVTHLLRDGAELRATVAGGWAVGSYTHQRKSRISADRPALLAELVIEYRDGTREVIGTGADWQVASDGPLRAAEWYDGEVVDATVDRDALAWRPVAITRPEGRPEIVAQVGPDVRVQQVMEPVSRTIAPSGEVVYDFGQNFAGVVSARIRGRAGQRVVFRHAEVLVDGELFVRSLRTAKATLDYTCAEGVQEYSPRFTYMGFRYVGVTGIDPDDLELTALVLHSDLRDVGDFACSDDRLTRLQSAIRWGGRSNFVDIPTDCPQRDEREGWTGDLAVFASTAAFNFDMSRFLDKWFRDMSAEQSRGGGIPMVVPRAGNPFPVMATSCWGDVCILAPWAEYQARGDLGMLRRQYPTMVRFLRAAVWWAHLFSLGRRRWIWRFPFHFGDWTSPDGDVKLWLKRGRWIGTAYLANSLGIAARIAELLGETADAERFLAQRARVVDAYRAVLTDGEGHIRNEFQTAYVLPLHFAMTEGDETRAMVDNLARLIDEAGGHLSTGFPGTPYILFALSDHGRLDDAYRLLLQTGCPSWLYMIESGGTTIWERWDALRPDGTVNTDDLNGGGDETGGMVSFNHYAAGAVGDWMYRRIAGLEPVEGGYRRFRVAPRPGGGLTWARATVRTPYGTASSAWGIRDGAFELRVEVPVSTTCEVELPDGSRRELASGVHVLTAAVTA